VATREHYYHCCRVRALIVGTREAHGDQQIDSIIMGSSFAGISAVYLTLQSQILNPHAVGSNKMFILSWRGHTQRDLRPLFPEAYPKPNCINIIVTAGRIYMCVGHNEPLPAALYVTRSFICTFECVTPYEPRYKSTQTEKQEWRQPLHHF
jgi:hypothetical protein